MVTRVCILGRSSGDAVRLLEALCEANRDDVYRRRQNVGIMNDGTELVAMSIQDRYNFYGNTFDYVFYEKGMMFEYCGMYGEAIEHLEKCCLLKSVVPREFQWSEIDMDI
mgnify:CR=1 FL=1